MIIGKKKIKTKFCKIDDIKKLKNLNNVYFSFDFWNTHKSEIISSKKCLGIIIDTQLPLETLNLNFNIFDLIIIKFDTFKNGKGFTFARKLREDYKFKKDIRASGHVLPDQYYFMTRCGFSSFEVECNDLKTWKEVINHSIKSHYQPTRFD